MKRRPAATDRDIADYIMRLPIGMEAMVTVQRDDHKAYLKPEGGLIIQQGGKRVIIAPIFRPRPWFHTEWGSAQYDAHVRELRYFAEVPL